VRALRFVPAVILGLSSVTVGASAAGANEHHGHDEHHSPQAYVCSGGNIPSGNYWSVLVTGSCSTPDGPITIHGDLTLAPNSALDDLHPDPTTGCSATINVRGNVIVGPGSVLALGSGPTTGGCPTTGHVGGSILAFGALGVIVHAETIAGDVLIGGGGGGVTCQPPGPLGPEPAFSTVEDSTIGGDMVVVGLQSCWFGALYDQIGGNAFIIGNTMADPDAMEVSTNTVDENMVCLANSPAIQFGDNSSGRPTSSNQVGEIAFGECGFDVLSPNPAGDPTVPIPPGPLTPISVPL
jgi:hypothetical protein